MALLEARNLKRTLAGDIPVPLVRQADVTLEAGEFISIVGPSGSGKSSLLYLLGLLDEPTEGQIFLQGQLLTGAPEHVRAQARLRQMGFVFQFHFLLPEFSALENVMLPMQRLGQLTETQARTRAAELLAQLGLAENMHKRPKQLSGGQSQRVSIARALANRPKVILADEPTGNLDTHSSENVQMILKGLTRAEGCAVVVVTHDPAFAARTDRTIHIVDGVVEPSATPASKPKKEKGL